MVDEMKRPPSANDPWKKPSLPGGLPPQPQEILRPRLPEAQVTGHDLGFEHALATWIIQRRSEWLKRRAADAPRIQAAAP